MFQNLLQIFNIIFDIQDITLCLKQNYDNNVIMSFNSKDKSTYLKLQWVNYINLYTYKSKSTYYI